VSADVDLFHGDGCGRGGAVGWRRRHRRRGDRQVPRASTPWGRRKVGVVEVLTPFLRLPRDSDACVGRFRFPGSGDEIVIIATTQVSTSCEVISPPDVQPRNGRHQWRRGRSTPADSPDLLLVQFRMRSDEQGDQHERRPCDNDLV